MKFLLKLFVLLYILPVQMSSQINNSKFEKRSSFFPDQDKLSTLKNVEWGYLVVPEDWDKPNGKKIKIAVAVLRKTSKNSDSYPVVYIPGGPGAGGIEEIRGWLQHPLRENNDIVLMDPRGTGFSFPRLCPDLGAKFLEILSKNQNSEQDEKEKTIAAMSCKEDLRSRNIDVKAYNSESVSKDLNALKKALNYTKWNVYSVSYGTYMAQVYSNNFPDDVKSLILDSSISDISQYFNHNTSNYIGSLEKVFRACENDSLCNRKFPNLEDKYYKTIENLNRKPITVSIDKKIIPSGKFTFNTEDFKIAIQQSLYNKKMIEVLPLLITEFNKRNENTISSLVAAFSGSLHLDYGVYYSVICNEAIPYNSIAAFEKDALQFKRLRSGLSFYKSDFSVCKQWNSGLPVSQNSSYDLSKLGNLKAPVLVFSGKFDPITPCTNGPETKGKFKNSYLVEVPIGGHAPSFSKKGAEIVYQFINNPNKKIDSKEFLADKNVHFVTDVRLNKGITKLAGSLNEFNLLFFAPLFIAFIILLVTVLNFCYVLIKKPKTTTDKVMKIQLVIASFLALFSIIGFIMAVGDTARNNFYILVFGLPDQFDYLFIIQYIFLFSTLISIIYFIIRIKVLSNRSFVVGILFSLIVINIYYQYWGLGI